MYFKERWDFVSFDDEKEMYPLIKRWLEERIKNPCDHVLVDNYTFNYARQVRRADLLGVYYKNDSMYFVGVEAKRDTDLSDKALRQADSLQSFCHEVFVALPRNDFRQLDEDDQDEIATLLQNKKMGLLLVAARGLPEVKFQRRVTSFQLDKYNEAVERFRYEFEEEEIDLTQGPINEETCQDILDYFLNDEEEYAFLEATWQAVETDEGGELSWNSGYIDIKDDEIDLSVTIDELSALRMFESPQEISENIIKALRKLRGQKMWNAKGLTKSPSLIVSVEYEDDNAYDPSLLPFNPKSGVIEIDATVLRNKDYVFQMASMFQNLEWYDSQVIARFSRKELLNPDEYYNESYLSAVAWWLKTLYKVISSIASALEVQD